MKDLIIGIDAGTSVIKSVAFTLDGEQVASSAVANEYSRVAGGGVEQDMERTWQSTVATLQGLAQKVPDFRQRVAAVAVTGQGDGTWLVDRAGQPVAPAWLWLDARAGDIVDSFRQGELDHDRFQRTGAGLAACQQGPHLMWMAQHAPELLANTARAMHCKDWLYYRLTNELLTDPSEGSFTFGDYRTRTYSDEVIDALGLGEFRRLLPPIHDGVEASHALSRDAALITGLAEGTPVVLGYVDVICTALGAGLYDPVNRVGCTIVGSTGMHMQLARSPDEVTLNEERTGYVMTMPVPGTYAQLQSNMAATLNIDWLLDVAHDLMKEFGIEKQRAELVEHIDDWINRGHPTALLYQPYISEAGERGPIIDSSARAGFVGLSSQHRFPDLVLAVVEGLAYAARDCYTAMGHIPAEIRLTGGAARSQSLRAVFGGVLGSRLRTSSREEAGAAGAAMMAAVCIGHHASMDECVQTWVDPLLGDPESPDAVLSQKYSTIFPSYVSARQALRPVWRQHAESRRRNG